jgi:glycosyltransferase involved in cell wall biosynthesis
MWGHSQIVDVSVVFPAYNEAAQIQHTLSEAVEYFEHKRRSFEIIVAADGTDGTREAAKRFGAGDARIRVIGHDKRRGKGRGIREAVAIANGAVIGFADADNKVPIDEFDKILPLFEAGHSVVIGSRALKTSRIERSQPLYRRIGARVFTVCLHAVIGGLASDTQCGFKFFTREAAQAIFALQRIDGYMFDVEILAYAKALGYDINEVPVRWRDDGDSRLRLVRGNLQNGIDLLRIRWFLAAAKPEIVCRRAAIKARSLTQI